MANIGDVFLRLLVDDKRFSADVEKAAGKAGDKAGATLGQRLGQGARGALAILSVGAGLATRGLLEMDNVMARFTADTGASAEEANRARKSILAMSASNLQPLNEIGAALGKVHTDLGLTGEAAEEVTAQFLAFARVTGRDAADEVAAFDDVLDAWGIEAKDAGGIMDQFVKSHQEFGGVIGDDVAALKGLAPAMKALNFSFDDSVGLLNLFKTKGLDAAATQRAFNTAVKNLPPGTNLKELLADIAAIPDPAERAQKAIEVFGSRGGVALANALGPGIGALEDYVVTTGEAAGATDAARDALDSTFGARIQLLLKGFTAKLIELGGNFGPVITGLASLASLAGALRLDKLLATAFKSIAGSKIVLAAAAAAGGAVGAVYETAWLHAAVGLDALKAAFAKLATSGPVLGAAKLAGTTWGKAAGLAFKLAFVVGIAAIADEIAPKLNDAGEDIHDALFKGPLEGIGDAFEGVGDWVEDLPWPLGPKDAPDWAKFGADTEEGLDTALVQPTNEAARLMHDDLANEVARGGDVVVGAMDDASDATGNLTDHTLDLKTAQERLQDAIADTAAALGGLTGAMFDQDIIAGNLAEAQQDLADLIAEGADATRPGDWTIYQGNLAEARKRVLELEAQYAQTQGAQEFYDWVLKQEAALGDADQATRDYIAHLKELARMGVITATGGFGPNTGKAGDHYAAGGRYSGTEPFYVGERGTELIVPDGPGRVIPHNALASMASPYAIASAVVSQLIGLASRTVAPSVRGGDTYNFPTHIVAQSPARNPVEIVRELRRNAESGTFSAAVRKEPAGV